MTTIRSESAPIGPDGGEGGTFSPEDCFFYHTMDLPGIGLVRGHWDLRGRERAYLGGVDFSGRTVLEVGTASGHLCFAMEAMGARVTAFDLSDEQDWDIVPYAGCDTGADSAERRSHIRLLNNGFLAARKALGSRADIVYGSVYDIPDDIGRFDICTFGCILLHLRDPFRAMQLAVAHVDGAVIVTDVAPRFPLLVRAGEMLSGCGAARFMPDPVMERPVDTWWSLTPRLVSQFLGVLGFPRTVTTYHRQLYMGRPVRLFTVVGRKAAVDPGPAGRRPGAR